MNTEQIIAAIDAEIARLQLARALIAQSVAPKLVTSKLSDRLAIPIPNAGKPAYAGKQKTHILSAEGRERIAAAQRKRWAEQKKPAAVTVTRVPAREAPRRRAPKPVAKTETPLTANIPNGPVAVPAKG